MSVLKLYVFPEWMSPAEALAKSPRLREHVRIKDIPVNVDAWDGESCPKGTPGLIVLSPMAFADATELARAAIHHGHAVCRNDRLVTPGGLGSHEELIARVGQLTRKK